MGASLSEWCGNQLQHPAHRTFELDGSNFPEDEVGLSLFDVLVVNDYRLRDLSGTQTAAIMNWVQDGGVLILGTGEPGR